jgi:hypothetical protein
MRSIKRKATSVGKRLGIRAAAAFIALFAIIGVGGVVVDTVNAQPAQAAVDPTGYLINNSSRLVKILENRKTYYVYSGQTSSYYVSDADSMRLSAGYCGVYHYSGRAGSYRFDGLGWYAIGGNVVVVDRVFLC